MVLLEWVIIYTWEFKYEFIIAIFDYWRLNDLKKPQ